jgi:Fic family protein
MTTEKAIWNPIEFNVKWLDVRTDRLDNILPSWLRKRDDFKSNPKEYEKFIIELKRKQAIDTGIIEKMYSLKEGITETFIKEGFVDSYLQHGDTDIDPNQLMHYLRDNFEAIDFIFDFVKNNRTLSVGFIKELHSLITTHQNYSSARTPDGTLIQVFMLKGEYKKLPNNPKRDSNDTLFIYCPPEQVASEMDNLIALMNNELAGIQPIIKAAFLHHAFTQIHPFQDGNGRIARLLASLIFIKDGLFPLAVDRKDKAIYIDALESADNNDYQPIIDFFVKNQVKSIERALNWSTIESEKSYSSIISTFADRVAKFKEDAIKSRNKHILNNMEQIYMMIKEIISIFIIDIKKQLGAEAEIYTDSCSPIDHNIYYFTKQIVDYANKHNYYFNSSYERCWIRVYFNISEIKRYSLVYSLHHYGYDNNTFALGAFIKKKNRDFDIDIPIEIPPLAMSSETDPSKLKEEIERYLQDIIVVGLGFIINEI